MEAYRSGREPRTHQVYAAYEIAKEIKKTQVEKRFANPVVT